MEAARTAYAAGDVPASVAAHEAKAGTLVARSKEDHGGAGSDYIKSIVFGGLDGIITTFAIVSSVIGASLSPQVVVVSGFAKLVGDAIAMGMGDIVSEMAEHAYIHTERAREMKETETMLDAEVNEMVEIYKSKGFSDEDAREVIGILTGNPAYKDFFVDHMMVQELGHQVPSHEDHPFKDGAVTFISFLIFGSLPLIPYCIFIGAKYEDKWGSFGVSIGVTILTLFLLGVVQAKIIRLPSIWLVLKQGLFMAINGGLAAGAAFLIGWGLEKAVGTC